MSEWRVFADKIEVFPHPNAEKLVLGRVGSFQVVVGKDTYKNNGEVVVFAPKRSILPADLRPYFTNSETGKSYLRGPLEDRVASIRLRGEESEGAILPNDWVLKHLGERFPLNEDLSKDLGITEYIPGQVSGKRNHTPDRNMVQSVTDAVKMDHFKRHDVEQYRIFANEFIPDELVFVTEKLHGSQISVSKDKFGNIAVTSKGRAEKGLVLREHPKYDLWYGPTLLKKFKNLYKHFFGNRQQETNEYWRVARSSGVVSFLQTNFDYAEVQVWGEVIPFQKDFSYGQTEPTIRIFRMCVNGREMPYGEYASAGLKWVPLLYEGIYDPDIIVKLANGKEEVSGKHLHIKEGIVLTPREFRYTKGVPLIVKILHPKYKSNDEDAV